MHLKDQGVYAAGGTVIKADGTFDGIHGQRADAGQLRYADHASVFYQIPEDGNGKRAFFLHGYGGSKVAWQKTPYSEGFADMFLADGYETYLADQPMYGSAAKVSKDATVSAKPDDLVWFAQFRLGYWSNFQEGTQFPISDYNVDPESPPPATPAGSSPVAPEVCEELCEVPSTWANSQGSACFRASTSPS